MGHELDGLKARVMRLERRSAVLVWSVCVLAFVVLSSVVLRGNEGQVSAQGTSKAVEAERFVLRDKGGHIKAEMGITDGETVFALYGLFGDGPTVVLAAGIIGATVTVRGNPYKSEATLVADWSKGGLKLANPGGASSTLAMVTGNSKLQMSSTE